MLVSDNLPEHELLIKATLATTTVVAPRGPPAPRSIATLSGSSTTASPKRSRRYGCAVGSAHSRSTGAASRASTAALTRSGGGHAARASSHESPACDANAGDQRRTAWSAATACGSAAQPQGLVNVADAAATGGAMAIVVKRGQ